MLRATVPWRTVRSFHGRPHYAGWYWSATTKGFVTYESRLELSRLILADQDQSISWIVSQPFLMSGRDDEVGRRRNHVPDFAFIERTGGVAISNVKPSEKLAVENVRVALEWAERSLATRGWRHEVWTGADPVLLANVGFLASYRIRERCSSEALSAVRSFVEAPISILEIEEACLTDLPVTHIRPAILHCIWTGELSANLEEPLDRYSLVGPSASNEPESA